MNDVLIVSAARLPIGRFGGALREVSDWDMGTIVIAEAMKRAGLKGDEIDEVIMAHGFRTGDLPANSARAVALRAGIPIGTPEFTINKACGGSIRAVSLAAQIIKAGEGDIMVAGGMESMSRAAYILPKVRWGSRLGHTRLIDQLILLDPISGYSLGETGENVGELYKISREDQDRFALQSQQKAEKAIKLNKFKEEIVAVQVPQPGRSPVLFDTDEHPRFGTTLEELSKLKPAFKRNGTVTAGNASGLNDGASAVVVMSRKKVKEMGIPPLVSIRSYASVGVKPEIMGIGPIPATQKALQKAGLELKDIDLRGFLENVIGIFDKRLKDKQLSLVTDVKENLPPIKADLFKLEQMLVNLLDNAVKYTDRGEITVSLDVHEKRIRIQVKDTGIGIPKDDIPRIFERFYVVDKSRSRKSGGTGLGLSIVKHIVLLHNGTINIESALGRGTSVTVTLPTDLSAS